MKWDKIILFAKYYIIINQIIVYGYFNLAVGHYRKSIKSTAI